MKKIVLLCYVLIYISAILYSQDTLSRGEKVIILGVIEMKDPIRLVFTERYLKKYGHQLKYQKHIRGIIAEGAKKDYIIKNKNKMSEYILNGEVYELMMRNQIIYENILPYCDSNCTSLIKSSYNYHPILFSPEKFKLYEDNIVQINKKIYYRRIVIKHFIEVLIDYNYYKSLLPLISHADPYVHDFWLDDLENNDNLYMRLLIPIINE